MVVCHICGAQNDPANRFCEQCGARLDPASEPVEPSTSEQTPTVPPITCSCGTKALPGQAFCDDCGNDLRQVGVLPVDGEAAPIPAQPDTKTVLAEPMPLPLSGVSAEPYSKTVLSVSPIINEGASDRPFNVDTRSADAETQPTPVGASPSPAVIDETTIDSSQSSSSPPAQDKPMDVQPPGDAPELHVAESPSSEVSQPPALAEEQPSAHSSHTRTVDIPDESDEERKKLEDEIARHRTTIEQMEQMIQVYPAGTAPDYLAQGLIQARHELEQTEKKRAQLSLKREPNPAEIARLEEIIRVHRGTITQFEEMKSKYPEGSVPSFLENGLQEARQSLHKTETDLAALREGKAPPSVAASSPLAKGPRLELFDGKHEFPLSYDKTEFIIGREDPVSQIFPEIDLTSYGGEAGGVSRQHARITCTGSEWHVADLDSTNHTRVDGQKVEPNTPVLIHDGTRLQFGRIAAVFRL